MKANEAKLKILSHDREITVKVGTVLLDAIVESGVSIDTACGGQRVCGRCAVQVVEGNIRSGEDNILTEEEKKKGWCLACAAVIEGDAIIELSTALSLKSQNILLDGDGGDISLKIESGYWKINPCIRNIQMKISPPTLDDCVSDLERIKREFLFLSLGIPAEKIYCGVSVLGKLGNILRESSWNIILTLSETGGHFEILDVQSWENENTKNIYGIAVDVGTTSIVVYLVDLVSGKKTGVKSSYNKQVRCGNDVISRIIYSQKKGGLKYLQNLVLDTINQLIGEFESPANDIKVACFAGNTTMIHLLLGMNPKSIRQEPYIPGATNFPIFKASEIGLKINPSGLGYCLPCVASYIGGDITAGVLRSELHKKEALTLFVDIGTNGEIVLGNKDWMMAASCSAGPAFEGGGVKNGMRAVEGAVEKVWADLNGEPVCRTIGDKKPCGICGSGIIDTLAFLFSQNIIDGRGKFRKENKNKNKNSRIRDIDGILEYVLIFKEDTHECKYDIVMTEIDIDNIIRAKGAIYAGFSVLVREAGVGFEDIDRFLIAGGLGNYLSIESAVKIGLLPDIEVEKFQYIGNSSVMGAYLALISKELMEEAEEIANSITNLELSVKPEFMDEYTKALFLPHTDLHTFPSVQKTLEN